MPKTIDMTPTWTAVLPILIAGLERGDATARKAAREELQRMAHAADLFNEETEGFQATPRATKD